MNKMTVIQLLNKIANGEDAPKKIKYDGSIYKFDKFQDDYMSNDNYEGLLDELCTFLVLNDEVEIIEEDKKIEPLKLNNSDVWTGKTNEDLIADKINEIIDYINKGDK